jgi:hypothetical protein
MRRLSLFLGLGAVGIIASIGLWLAVRPAQPSLPGRPLPTVTVQDSGDPLPTGDEMERLARDDVIAFVENCLRRYQREVQGYKVTMQKHERIGGTLNPVEVIDVAFREKPHSVLMIWRQGARLAERSLYVEGDNDGKLLARPNGWRRFIVGDIAVRDVDGNDARSSGRYTMAEFGLKMAAQRALASLRDSQAKGDFHVEYLGIQNLPEAGGRPCYTFRQSFAQPDQEGIKTATISVDTDTWLQVGSVLARDDGSLVGAYYFRDLVSNPTFDPQQFTRAALMP